MKECKNCKTRVDEGITKCNICKYPIGGNEKEQASFIAKQVMQKGDVLESIKRVKASRMILFILGGFNTIIPIIIFAFTYNYVTLIEFIFSITLGLLLIGFGFLSFKKPNIALVIPLSLFLIYYIYLFSIDPNLLYSGIVWKIIIIMGLGYGYFSVRKSDKILKNNEYLASLLQGEK